MTIKEEMKPKKEKENKAEDFTDDYKEEKKPEEKSKKLDSKYELLKLKRCINDKDKRISKLEKRLNDRIKYWKSLGVISLFVSSWLVGIYLAFTDIEALGNLFIGIGIIASVLASILVVIICFYIIWDEDSK